MDFWSFVAGVTVGAVGAAILWFVRTIRVMGPTWRQEQEEREDAESRPDPYKPEL